MEQDLGLKCQTPLRLKDFGGGVVVVVKLLGLGFDFTFTCQGENHCNPWIKPLQPLDKTTATLG